MELDNKTIGKNIAQFRKLREMKASEMAEKLGMKEAAYTKYERGETAITIDMIQQIAKALKMDPYQILSMKPGNFIESINNSQGFANYVQGDLLTCNQEQTQLMLKLMENMVALNERLVAILDKKKE